MSGIDGLACGFNIGLNDHRFLDVRNKNFDIQKYPKSLEEGSATFKCSSKFLAQFLELSTSRSTMRCIGNRR